MSVTSLLVRIVFALHAALAVVQPVLAGAYLGGDFDMLGLHGVNGVFVAWLGILAVLASVAHAIAGGSRWPVPATVLVLLGETTQIVLGYSGVLAIHVPLGVAIVAATVVLAFWSLRTSVGKRQLVSSEVLR